MTDIRSVHSHVATKRGVQLLCIPFNSAITSSWGEFRLRRRKRRFSQELEVVINPFRWLFGRPHFPNQRAAGNLPRTNKLRIIHPERTKKLPELTSFRVFTERTKKLAEPTSFRVFTERKRKLAEPTRLKILTERTKQRLWLLLIGNSRNDVFQPLSRTSKNGSNQKYSREEYTRST